MSITLYDLGAEYHRLYAKKHNNGEVQVQIVNDDTDKEVYNETSNIAAWESLVYLAKQILDADNRIQQVEK